MNEPKRIQAFLRHHAFEILGALGALAILGAGIFLQLRHEAIATELASIEQRGGKVLQTITRRSVVAQQLETARATTKHLDEHLVRESDLAGNIAFFYELEEQTQVTLVQVRQFKAAPVPAGRHYLTVPFALQINGPYPAVLEYLNRLETSPRVLRVRNFSLARIRPDATALDLDLEVEILGAVEKKA